MVSEADLFIDDVEDAPAGPAPIIVGRSELERWATCPHQAALIDRKMVSTGNHLTDVGNAVHGILSQAVAMRVDGCQFITVRDEMALLAEASRPDIQPDVIDSLNTYACARIICQGDGGDRNPADIIRYDGGEGDHKGQIAAELLPAEGDRPALIITGELDLLTATVSPVEVALDDWKSGWKHWTAGDVEKSFQFQVYALLIFLNYPTVTRVRVRVVETRKGETTAPVVFTREKHYARTLARVKAAAALYLQHRGTEDVTEIPAWPEPDKCSICDAAERCVKAHVPGADVARDPEGYLREYVAVSTRADRMKAALTVARRERFADFDFGDVAFGTDKPKASRAATCDVYKPPPA